MTYADVQSIFPFDNDILLCSIRGGDLRRRFVQTNNSDYHIATADGLASSIDDNAIYYVVVDSYTASYAPNNLPVLERLGQGIYARDLLANYFESIS